LEKNIDKKKEFFKELEFIEDILSDEFNADGSTFLKKIDSVEQYLRVIGVNIKDLKSLAKLDKNSDISDIDEKLKNVKFISNIIFDESRDLVYKKLEREELEGIVNGNYKTDKESSMVSFLKIIGLGTILGLLFIYLISLLGSFF
jgi:predicted RND superfamily exporter protein